MGLHTNKMTLTLSLYYHFQIRLRNPYSNETKGTLGGKIQKPSVNHKSVQFAELNHNNAISWYVD